MNEMIERVARAGNPMGWSWYDRAENDHPAKPVFYAREMNENRARIEAMREPTEAMQDAARDADIAWRQDYRPSRLFDAVWRGMIDAALTDHDIA